MSPTLFAGNLLIITFADPVTVFTGNQHPCPLSKSPSRDIPEPASAIRTLPPRQVLLPFAYLCGTRRA